MAEPLIIAIPSKGRLKDQVEAWLADCGLPLVTAGGARGYVGALGGFDDIQLRLASAADISAALLSGDVHLGVTGEDLLREAGESLKDHVEFVMALGFGRADLVVAAPKSWIDVETMADLDDVARLYLARTGRRLRVATKYRVQTRAFFARHGIADYRLSDSSGATEGAPAAGAAELVVDITSSGATLAANGLKPVSDGLILSSQAHLAASLACVWSGAKIEAARRLVRILEARARGKSHAALAWPAAHEELARNALAACLGHDRTEAGDVLVPVSTLFAAAQALSEAGVGPITVTRPAYVFEAGCKSVDRLAQAVAAAGPRAPAGTALAHTQPL